MSARRSIIRVVGIGVLALMASACRREPPNPTRPRRPRPTTTTLPPTTTGAKLGSVTIGVVVPHGGLRLSEANGVRNSVDLAVRHASEDGILRRWNVTVEELTEGAKPDDPQRLARAVQGDRRIIGVIGPLGSDFTLRFLAALADEPLAVLSPAATDTALTAMTTASPTAPADVRFHNFLRLAPARDVVAARAVGALAPGSKSVVIVHDGSTESRALAGELESAVAAAGLTLATPILMDADTNGVSAAVQLVLASGADAVIAANHPVDALALSNGLLVTAASPVRVVSIGRVDAAPCSVVSVRPTGDVCVEAAAFDDGEMAHAFAEDYGAEQFAEPPGPYGPAAYDAARLLLDAIAAVDPAQDPASSRQRVIDSVRHADHQGVSGLLVFARSGDRIGP